MSHGNLVRCPSTATTSGISVTVREDWLIQVVYSFCYQILCKKDNVLWDKYLLYFLLQGITHCKKETG